ncbi:XTP/dITP diphosphatase [Pediococcus claussenii]|uniref:dITP/XTP pyrophosphatase n=1 Tax=Pediococcus claussenii (strain ATCC BAA-344 / DSM 14800 / JCM 18046 / KCTC 3811 / LMG 21948 / P06) TaxID=701521 RepID=G8PCN6_PEDCP|nr:XTP/dITP diphosphatase [Pediococcus claussenii]AEV95021.1 non-canonical purine NTP pyrophosphatase, RdgB/HAM1 family [Pediococcus claussenii ATCC BAA-344]ANZ70210.1 non-canonical purine NTP pyrophosphatase [Pediococcus claussenii]ANZ72026.1 non-canonical purine NTP pyrophosphatase [Pediococcus claussenii]KRN19177.1 rdgB protein [Pediococcus claussenii]
MKKSIIIASNNAGKVREFKNALTNFEIKSLGDIGIESEVKENGLTFEENARLKADAYSKLTGLPVIADDSGLQVDALNGRPGVFSARYAGDHNDAANNAKILTELGGLPSEKRKATFHTTLIFKTPDGEEVIANGDLKGRILSVPRGKNGFGYDPLFFVPTLGKSLAELTVDQKNKISHRALAIQELVPLLQKYQ